jgi:hypothetical protein
MLDYDSMTSQVAAQAIKKGLIKPGFTAFWGPEKPAENNAYVLAGYSVVKTKKEEMGDIVAVDGCIRLGDAILMQVPNAKREIILKSVEEENKRRIRASKDWNKAEAAKLNREMANAGLSEKHQITAFHEGTNLSEDK